MKLLYIASGITGSGGVARVLSARLTDFVQCFGMEVLVVSTNDQDTTPFYDFHPAVRFQLLEGSFASWRSMKRFCFLLRELVEVEKPDRIVVTDNGFKAYLIPWFLFSSEVMIEVHGSRHHLFSKTYSSKTRAVMERILSVMALKFSKVILLNDGARAEWKHPNMEIIPNYREQSLDSNAFSNQNKIIAIGRVVEGKGYDRMLRIFESIQARYPNWSLHIYGALDDLDYVESLSTSPRLNVFFEGTTSDVSAALEDSEFLIHTSYHEGFCMAILDALALGRAVVAFDVPFGLEALVLDGDTGYLVPDGDLKGFEERVVTLIENVELRHAMGRRARSLSQRFTKETVLQSWWELLNPGQIRVP